MAPSSKGGSHTSPLAGVYPNSIPHHAHEPVDRTYAGHCSTKAFPHNYCGCGELSAKPAHGPYLRCLGWQPESDTWAGSALFVCKPSVSERPGLSWRDSEGHSGHVEAEFLDCYCDWNVWRFALEVPMGEDQKSVEYWVDVQEHQAYTFYVAGREQPWHWGYYSCNGFTESVDEEERVKKWRGIDPLWIDVLKRHEAAPIHAIVGGGDQLYSDDVMQCPSLRPWFDAAPSDRIKMEWNDDMNREVEEYYFHHYAVHYSYGPVGRANASIPMMVSWDDHDIYDGFGSYPAPLQNCPVFQGIFRAARRFYLLFQLQTTHELAHKHGCFGRMSYNQLVLFGPRVAIAMPDCRSERTRHQVLSLETHLNLVVKVTELPESVRHLVVCTTVPVVYPTIIGGERTLAVFRKLGQYKIFKVLFKATGIYSALFSKYGEPGLLDDLRDHWNALTHKEETRFLIEHLQMLARTKMLRVSFISGDVHLAAVGRLYTRPKVNFRHDFRFMPQIVSSAIANVPPPDALVKLLRVVGRAGHVNRHTAHKMVKTFQGGERLLNERNWCEVWELDPRSQWAAAADTSSSSSGSSSGSSGGWGTARHGRAVGHGQGRTKGQHDDDHTTADADVANSRDQDKGQVMRGSSAPAQHTPATATAPSPASQTGVADAAGGTPGAATAASAAAAGPHAAATTAQAGNTGQPVLQPRHRGEAQPGALVYALRLEHLTKRAESGAVLREYQVVVPRLERPEGMEDGVTDTQPFGRGRGWTSHPDRKLYTRTLRRPSTARTGSSKDKVHQATRDTREQTGAES